jgi:hypothetical protein
MQIQAPEIPYALARRDAAHGFSTGKLLTESVTISSATARPMAGESWIPFPPAPKAQITLLLAGCAPTIGERSSVNG